MDHEAAPLISKPLLRGHFHQAAFFFALGACGMLLAESQGTRSRIATFIYSLSLVGLFGVSALYHRPNWGAEARRRMRRIDHSAIFVLIAGTGTPIFMLAIPHAGGMKLLLVVWLAALVGIMQTLFWVNAPKWLAAILYIVMGWLALPYIPEINASLGARNGILLVVGGIIYTLGALVYAFKKPNPAPAFLGYHEVFHLMVIIAAALHFLVIANLIMSTT